MEAGSLLRDRLRSDENASRLLHAFLMSASPAVPGPFESYRRVRRDIVAFLSDLARDGGDFVPFRVLAFPYLLVNDPALIREALVDHSETLIIKGGASAGLARLIGHGILTNRGED